MDDFFTTMPSILRDDTLLKTNVPVNIRETQDGYLLELFAPGMNKEDFRINLDNNTLTISADKKEEERLLPRAGENAASRPERVLIGADPHARPGSRVLIRPARHDWPLHHHSR